MKGHNCSVYTYNYQYLYIYKFLYKHECRSLNRFRFLFSNGRAKETEGALDGHQNVFQITFSLCRCRLLEVNRYCAIPAMQCAIIAERHNSCRYRAIYVGKKTTHSLSVTTLQITCVPKIYSHNIQVDEHSS